MTIRELLSTTYDFRNEPMIDDLWIEWGIFDTAGKFSRRGAGRLADIPKGTSIANMAVYVSAGVMKPGMTRSNENVERVYILTIDDVGTTIDKDAMEVMAPQPTTIIETSPGNYQWQYAIYGGMEVDTYRNLRAYMKQHPIWGSSHATAPSNLVRLPVGVNGKPGKAGHKLVESGGRHKSFSDWWLVQHFAAGITPGGPSGHRVTMNELRAPREEMVEDILKALPNDGMSAYCDSYQAWINFGMALWGATGGERVDLWEDWCAGQPQRDDPAAKWDTFKPTASGWATLVMYADKWGSDRGALAGALFNDGETLPVDSGDNDTDEIEALQRDVANMIVRSFGDRIRYNVSTSLWHRFDGTWVESPHALGYRLAKRWADGAAGTLGKSARAAVSKSAFYEGVEKILRSDEHLAVVKTDFDRDNWLLGTPRGTVELRTGALVPARAADMISLSTAVVPSDSEDCPRWLKFIDWVCTDPSEPDPLKRIDKGMRSTLKQWAGLQLTGDVSQELVMFLHGGGANGKGTFIETLHAALGDYFYMATKDLFMEGKFGAHTEEIAALAGKRMVAADEVPTNARWNESLLKGVSGGGVMTSRHLYGRVFQFPIRFKVTIIGNDKPTFQGAINEALKRRLRMVEFQNVARPPDPSLKTVLAAEAPGVLRWMINGLLDMLREPGGKLFVADSVNTATDEYFNENDLFGRWLSECTARKAGVEVLASEAFASWEAFRNNEGGGSLFNHPRSFKAEMMRRDHVWNITKINSFIKDLTVKIPAPVF